MILNEKGMLIMSIKLSGRNNELPVSVICSQEMRRIAERAENIMFSAKKYTCGYRDFSDGRVGFGNVCVRPYRSADEGQRECPDADESEDRKNINFIKRCFNDWEN